VESFDIGTTLARAVDRALCQDTHQAQVHEAHKQLHAIPPHHISTSTSFLPPQEWTTYAAAAIASKGLKSSGDLAALIGLDLNEEDQDQDQDPDQGNGLIRSLGLLCSSLNASVRARGHAALALGYLASSKEAEARNIER